MAQMEYFEGLREEEPGLEIRDITGEPLSVRDQTGEWFDSVQGLRTMQALRGYLENNRDAIKLPTHSAQDFERYHRELLEEFQLCERFLQEAVESGQQFRLVIVP
ncbi:hypothetical protein SAMN05444166_2775 [Singulisphaera sp. GP187]|nr:hypothetical protein SAMN05444166_2775 [Singulisphaera sp. GP187]